MTDIKRLRELHRLVDRTINPLISAVACREIHDTLPALLDELEAARKVVEAAKDAVSACHLRTHGFPEGDISDLDHSKLLPAIVALDAALSAHTAAWNGGGAHAK